MPSLSMPVTEHSASPLPVLHGHQSEAHLTLMPSEQHWSTGASVAAVNGSHFATLSTCFRFLIVYACRDKKFCSHKQAEPRWSKGTWLMKEGHDGISRRRCNFESPIILVLVFPGLAKGEWITIIRCGHQIKPTKPDTSHSFQKHKDIFVNICD